MPSSKGENSTSSCLVAIGRNWKKHKNKEEGGYPSRKDRERPTALPWSNQKGTRFNHGKKENEEKSGPAQGDMGL